MKRVLINASNLHTGGGVQVATSFIAELAEILDQLPGCDVTLYVSNAVDANLLSLGFVSKVFYKYEVFDVRGLEALTKKNSIRFQGFDLVFTLFGPLYLFRDIPNHIIGFAQSWILYPDNEVALRISLSKRAVLRLKFIVQWLFFRRASRLVVELEHVKERLSGYLGYSSRNIDVVHNCFSRVFLNPEKWECISGLDREEGFVSLGYVTRAYPHKNIDLLLDIALELKRISKINYRFFVTLNDEEWMSRSEGFRQTIVNVGPISSAQCPTFYSAMSGVVFPSLLECFSATPLEAMVMRRPLFASAKGFVRDCCGDNARYFDPLDAGSAAETIHQWFAQMPLSERDAFIDRAYRHVMSLSGSKDRAVAYVDIIKRQLEN